MNFKFLRLDDSDDGAPIFINPGAVAAVTPSLDGTNIWVIGSEQTVFKVKQTSLQVVEMIETGVATVDRTPSQMASVAKKVGDV